MAADEKSIQRLRLQIEITPAVATVLDHVSEVLGVPRAQIVLQGLLRVLPDLVGQSEQIRQKAGSLGKGPKR
jgi:hypothetical protein